MSCLDATFTLRPRQPWFWQSPHAYAALFCYGADFAYVPPTDLPTLFTNDRFFFDAAFAADPNLNYSQWSNRKKARHLIASLDLQDVGGSQRELALIFGFDVLYPNIDGRVQVYSDAGLLSDQVLVQGDNQFLIHVEALGQPLNLYFIHAGGYWFFRGLSGYVV